MRAGFLILGLSVFSTVPAQEADSSVHFSLFTNLTHNVDRSHPRINLGVDVQWPKVGLALIYGRYIDNWYTDRPASGNALTVSVREKIKGAFSYNVQFTAAQFDHEVPFEWERREHGYSWHYDTVLTVQKTVYDLSVLFSARFHPSGRIWLQPFLGVGCRWRLNENDFDNYEPDADEVGLRAPDPYSPGTAIWPVLRSGVFVGVRFASRRR